MARGRSIFREYGEAILIALIFLRFANAFVVQTFYIPSGSMEDTLLVGDRLFVNRFIYGPAATDLERKLLPLRPVERGDIVVFRSPEDPQLDLVKRCVAVGGDTIQMVDQKVTIDGQPVDDSSYAVHREPPELAALPPALAHAQRVRRDNFGPFKVQPGQYFCLGDNRENSNDSRFWGTLPASMVKGRAFMVYWSYGGETPNGHWEGYAHKLEQIGHTLAGFFTKTRWGRTFHIVR